jgi:hypothetical protein
MSRNQKNETPQQRADSDKPSGKANEIVEGDPMKVPVEPTDAEPKPAERPDLIWAEHED